MYNYTHTYTHTHFLLILYKDDIVLIRFSNLCISKDFTDLKYSAFKIKFSFDILKPNSRKK